MWYSAEPSGHSYTKNPPSKHPSSKMSQNLATVPKSNSGMETSNQAGSSKIMTKDERRLKMMSKILRRGYLMILTLLNTIRKSVRK
jgi:uncharacterized lipoprotein YajG